MRKAKRSPLRPVDKVLAMSTLLSKIKRARAAYEEKRNELTNYYMALIKLEREYSDLIYDPSICPDL